MKPIQMGKWMCAAVLWTGCQGGGGIENIKCQLTVEAPVVTFDTTAVGVETPLTVRVSAAFADCNVTTVNVNNNDGTYFHATEVAVGDAGDTDEGLTATTTIKVPVDGSAEIPIIYYPRVTGYHTATVTLAVSNARSTNIEFQVRGHADVPEFAIYPWLIDFGAVPVGQFGSGYVTIDNNSDLPLVIDDFTFNAADGAATTSELGSVPIFPVTVEPKVSAQLEVRYTPAILRKMAANMYVVIAGQNAQAIRLMANDCDNGVPESYDKDVDGFTTCGGDCDDNDSNVHPGAVEISDGKDNDCNSFADDTTRGYDDDDDGYCDHPTTCGTSGVKPGDCNDGDQAVNPGVREVCPSADPACFDGVDNDCDGTVDGGTADLDGDGYTEIAGDCEPQDGTVFPGAREVPDGKDNDCDLISDEGTVLYDDDGDSYCEGLVGTSGCTYGTTTGDCDDSVDPLDVSNPFPGAIVNPGELEAADHIDNDCDRKVDEGTIFGDDDGDGFTEAAAEPYKDCDDGDADIGPHMFEILGNGVDEDCDLTTGP